MIDGTHMHDAKTPEARRLGQPGSALGGAAGDDGSTERDGQGRAGVTKARRRRRAAIRLEERKRLERARALEEAAAASRKNAFTRVRGFFRRRIDQIAAFAAAMVGVAVLGLGLILLPLPIPLGLPMILVGGFIVVQRIPAAKRAWRRFRDDHPVWDEKIQAWFDAWERFRRKRRW